jgi:hypothetical protein
MLGQRDSLQKKTQKHVVTPFELVYVLMSASSNDSVTSDNEDRYNDYVVLESSTLVQKSCGVDTDDVFLFCFVLFCSCSRVGRVSSMPR